MLAGGCGSIALLEVFPILYYNIRYLTFAAVPLLISAIVSIGTIVEKSPSIEFRRMSIGKKAVASLVLGALLASALPYTDTPPLRATF